MAPAVADDVSGRAGQPVVAAALPPAGPTTSSTVNMDTTPASTGKAAAAPSSSSSSSFRGPVGLRIRPLVAPKEDNPNSATIATTNNNENERPRRRRHVANGVDSRVPATAPLIANFYSSSALGSSQNGAFLDDLSIRPPNPSSLLEVGPSTAPLASTSSGALTPLEAGADGAADAPMGGRAKRIRAVKFTSPSKTKLTNSKRAAAAVAAGNIANAKSLSAATSAAPPIDDDAMIPNNDWCDSCAGKGHFLCCDGCPRSFHFTCLNPPLKHSEIPLETWYCNACSASRSMPPVPKGIFGPLLHRADIDNPKVFVLSKDIKNSFRNITTGNFGEYVDSNEFRPLSGLGKAGKGGYEDRDPYRLVKDKSGTLASCHSCGGTADQSRVKRILGCDFCELYWHLDCLDPPLVGMPAVTRKWMCPMHAEKAIPPSKKLKHQKLIKVKDPHIRNNGDIEIIPQEGRFAAVKHAPEEMISQGLRYQVPEQVVILDFWSRIRRDRPVSHKAGTPQSATTFDFSDASSLTSMEASPERDMGLKSLDISMPPAASTNSSQAARNRTERTVELSRSDALDSDREGTEVSDGDPPDLDNLHWDESTFDNGEVLPSGASTPLFPGAAVMDVLLSAANHGSQQLTPSSSDMCKTRSSSSVSMSKIRSVTTDDEEDEQTSIEGRRPSTSTPGRSSRLSAGSANASMIARSGSTTPMPPLVNGARVSSNLAVSSSAIPSPGADHPAAPPPGT